MNTDTIITPHIVAYEVRVGAGDVIARTLNKAEASELVDVYAGYGDAVYVVPVQRVLGRGWVAQED